MSDYKMVPVVATAGMGDAGAVAQSHYIDGTVFSAFDMAWIDREAMRSAYDAMLAAAPPFVVTDEFVIRMCNAYDKARGEAALSDPAEFPAMYAAIEAVLGGAK